MSNFHTTRHTFFDYFTAHVVHVKSSKSQLIPNWEKQLPCQYIYNMLFDIYPFCSEKNESRDNFVKSFQEKTRSNS